MLAPRCSLPVLPKPVAFDTVPVEFLDEAGHVRSLMESVSYRIDNATGMPELVFAMLRDLAFACDNCVEVLSRNVSQEPEGAHTASSISELARVLTPEILQLDDTADYEQLISIFGRYDSYFGTTRSNSLDSASSLKQMVVTASAVFSDLQFCLLDLNEIRAIIDALATVLPTPPGIDKLPREEYHPQHGHVGYGDSRETALYRWKLSHHLFNILTSHATVAVQIASTSVSENEIAAALDRAAVLLRGTTAAMWYGEAFPRALYANHIRPSMVEASGKGSGFSGTDNLEFRLFKLAVARLRPSFERSFGEPGDWPEPIWLAAYKFFDARELDLEHHTLLAEKVVGSQPSLKQVRLMQEVGTPQSAADLPAVEALRALARVARAQKEQLI